MCCLNRAVIGLGGDDSCDALISPWHVRCADITLMRERKSADEDDECYLHPNSFEFDCVADGGEPITYDPTLLAGGDVVITHSFFAAAELESWQL